MHYLGGARPIGNPTTECGCKYYLEIIDLRVLPPQSAVAIISSANAGSEDLNQSWRNWILEEEFAGQLEAASRRGISDWIRGDINGRYLAECVSMVELR